MTLTACLIHVVSGETGELGLTVDSITTLHALDNGLPIITCVTNIHIVTNEISSIGATHMIYFMKQLHFVGIKNTSAAPSPLLGLLVHPRRPPARPPAPRQAPQQAAHTTLTRELFPSLATFQPGTDPLILAAVAILTVPVVLRFEYSNLS